MDSYLARHFWTYGNGIQHELLFPPAYVLSGNSQNAVLRLTI